MISNIQLAFPMEKNGLPWEILWGNRAWGVKWGCHAGSFAEFCHETLENYVGFLSENAISFRLQWAWEYVWQMVLWPRENRTWDPKNRNTLYLIHYQKHSISTTGCATNIYQHDMELQPNYGDCSNTNLGYHGIFWQKCCMVLSRSY